jgi:hypothetical protein
MMFSVLLSAAFSLDIDPFGAILYPSIPLTARLPNGKSLSLFGAFFPNGGPTPISLETIVVPSVQATFSPLCREIIVSTNPTESIRLDQGDDPDHPITDICLWYYSHPSRVTFDVHQASGASRLMLEYFDGKKVSEEITGESSVFEIKNSILVHWHNDFKDLNSYATVSAIQWDDSIPWKGQSIRFAVTNETQYFEYVRK